MYEPSYLLVKWCRHARVQFILKFRAPTVDRYCLIIVKLVATTRVSRLLEQDLLPVPRTWVHLYLLPVTCAEDMSTSISVTCYLLPRTWVHLYLLPVTCAEDMRTSIYVTCYLCRGHEYIYICYLCRGHEDIPCFSLCFVLFCFLFVLFSLFVCMIPSRTNSLQTEATTQWQQ